MSFSEKLQKLRKEKKMSQEELADMLDVTRQSVSKWESGTTYPEMDKLIAMTKIFKCSLDDLTNDEISDIKFESKKGNNLNNVIDAFLEIIDKSVNMFRSMSAKEIVGTVISLIILGIVLQILKVPFNMLETSFQNLLISTNRPAFASFTSGLFNFILDFVFIALYILVFVYIYKIAYLDKYEIKNEPVKREEVLEKPKSSTTNEVKVTTPKNNTNAFFTTLGAIILGFIKLIIAFFSIPLLFIIIGLFAGLAIDLYLIFHGVFYFGILLLILFSISISIVILELIIVFIFNKTIAFKRLLWTFIVSLAGIGIASGIFALEVSKTEYLENTPVIEFNKVDTKEFDITDATYIDNDVEYAGYYYHYKDKLEYKQDETLKDKVRVEVSYNDEFNNVNIVEKENSISVDAYSKDELTIFKKITTLMINDLKEKKIHNYNDIDNLKITISASSKNIEILKNNASIQTNREKEKYEEEIENSKEYENLYEELDEKNEQISNYENKISELESKLEELETEFSDYKERINSAVKD